MTNVNFRKDPIPKWINIVNIVVIGILCFQIYSALFNPSLAYGTYENVEANKQVLLTLVGRNFVMIIVTFLALRSQNAMFLAFTFLMNIARESFDMALVGYLNHFSLKGIGQMMSFLIFLIPYFFALKKLRQLASRTE